MKKPLLFLLLIGNTALAQVNMNLGLKAYYPFSGNANDISGNNNNPSFNNAVLTTDRFGVPNSAYLFNGTNSYMQIPNSASINPTNQISLCAWVKVNGFYQGPCHGNSIIMKGDADYLTGNYLLRFDDNAYTNGQNCVNPVVDPAHQNFYGVNPSIPPGYTPYIQTGQWYSVVYTYDGVTAKLYVNCQLKASGPLNLTFSNSYDLFFGKMNHASFPYWLNGVMDEVRIYNRPLNQDEINAYGDCTLPLTCNNWLSTPVEPSYVRTGDLDISGNQITVEANFNRTAALNPVGGYGFLVSKHTGPGNINYALWPNGCAITTATGGDRLIYENCDIQLNKTYHVAMVYNGSSLKFYRNGFLHSQTPASGNLVLNDLITTIGQNVPEGAPTIFPFIGYMNEVRIWNVARTQGQIQAYMNGSLPDPPTQTGLVAYYTFDNLLNKQGNTAYNGTLFGSAAINATNTSCTFLADSCPVNLNISGIINAYTPVLALNPCDNKITVENAAAFAVGDTVLMIQMKGAVIDSTNTASFGTITDYKNAGNYEFNYVKSKAGNIIELTNVLTRQYDIPNGKVQLVRVPYYQKVTITSTLTCLPWDGSKGGVLVLNVQDSVILNASIDVSGKGFRGGVDPFTNPSSFYCYENQFYYPANPDLASGKGEGIAEISSAKSFGKGALANGGGGGNSHNSGGGGGSNAAPGGFGGYNFEGSPCDGTVPFDNRGIGGKTLTYSNAANKIFLGGGGGAGHTNNPEAFQAIGGNGSGIAIIMANKLLANGNKVIAKGNNAASCTGTGSGCHDGMGGGGAGGTVLLNISNYLDASVIEIMGGSGGNMTAAGFQKVGPGGGGGGGKVWLTNPSLPATVTATVSGGPAGVCTAYSNDPWGAAPGQLGSTLFNLSIPFDVTPFKANIDSVRIKDSATSCNTFDFKGFGYTNTNPIATWQWYFGDGGTANTQNTSHTYLTSGTFPVKLVVTDINGCKDSITTNVTTIVLNFDFSYQVNACSPLVVQFNGEGTDTQNPYWSFGDGNTSTGSVTISHTYGALGTYLVRYSVSNAGCTDTISKTIDLSVIQDNIISTTDTTICFGSTKQLLTIPSLNFCWTPVTYLNNASLPNPITSTPQNIIYYFTAQVTGTNLVTNGNFSGGNTGFTSQYSFTNPNSAEGQYSVGTNPQSWNAVFSACTDHTTGSGNMMLVNGASTTGVKVWTQTIPVATNTNYAFSAWIQSLAATNPAQIQFDINGVAIGPAITASVPVCTWSQFYTTWNSGNITSAVISIINKNIVAGGSDFALDDISFAPVFIKRDSVKIMVDTPSVVTNADTPICEGTSIQLNTTGASTYSWTPATGLSNTNIPNPLATPAVTTQYIVTGTNANGCIAKDSVWITINPAPVVTTSADTTICQSGSAQLFASGGSSYSWSPAATLSNASAPNPVATPSSNTMYYVTVTGANSCSKMDSVKVDVRTAATFTINTPGNVCMNSSAQLLASGGDLYSWTPSASLNNAAIANPVATPVTTTTYTVQITDTLCNNTGNLSTTVTVMPLPVVTATRSNDIDCSILQSQLSATGAATYSWSPASTLNNPVSAAPIATPLVTTTYSVTGTDLSGCSNSASIIVKVSPTGVGSYLMPTAFTPNNDGKNDCYGIKQWGTITKLEFSIYNRWGERVFYTTEVGKCWDGTYKGVTQDPDVFVFMIKASTTCQPEVFRKGVFALIR